MLQCSLRQLGIYSAANDVVTLTVSDGEHHVHKNVPLTSDLNNTWQISGFRRGVREIFALLRCYMV